MKEWKEELLDNNIQQIINDLTDIWTNDNDDARLEALFDFDTSIYYITERSKWSPLFSKACEDLLGDHYSKPWGEVHALCYSESLYDQEDGGRIERWQIYPELFIIGCCINILWDTVYPPTIDAHGRQHRSNNAAFTINDEAVKLAADYFSC